MEKYSHSIARTIWVTTVIVATIGLFVLFLFRLLSGTELMD